MPAGPANGGGRPRLPAHHGERGKRPDLFDAAFLARRYRGEFGIAEIPALAQRLVFPAQVAAG